MLLFVDIDVKNKKCRCLISTQSLLIYVKKLLWIQKLLEITFLFVLLLIFKY